MQNIPPCPNNTVAVRHAEQSEIQNGFIVFAKQEQSKKE